MTQKLKGFTLIELIVVIGILVILAAIVIVAINPARQFAQARNARRSSDVNAILNAVHQVNADNNGQLIPDIAALADNVATPICNDKNGVAAPNCAVGTVDLRTELVPTYVTNIPNDPSCIVVPSCELNTKYTVAHDADDRITVAAPDAELGTTVSITR